MEIANEGNSPHNRDQRIAGIINVTAIQLFDPYFPEITFIHENVQLNVNFHTLTDSPSLKKKVEQYTQQK